MIVAFRNRKAAALFLGASLTLVSMPALAQVQLFPAPTEETAPAATAPAAPAAPSGMAVEELGGIDVEAVGALTNPAEALPATLWADLSRSSIVALIDGLPASSGYPAARNLARRLLLSPGAVPPPDDSSVSIIQARIEALVRLGFATEASNLGLIGADALSTPDGMATRARAQLAGNDLPNACGTAASASKGSNVFWDKLLAFCQALAGQKDQAALSAQTLADMGVEDPLYFSLMESLTLGFSPEIVGEAAGPLHFALLQATEAQAPVDSDDPLISQLAALQSENLSLAEQAAMAGVIAPDALAVKYLASRFKQSALETPLEVLDRVSAPAARALLYQVVQSYEIPALKAEAIAVALQRARGDGVSLAIAPLFADSAATITPSADLLWFAEDAARLFYMTGDVQRAQAWHQLLRQAASTDASAVESDARLWHLAMLSGETGSALGQSRQGWGDAIRAVAADEAEGAEYVTLLTALTSAAIGGDALSTDADLRAKAMAAQAEGDAGASAVTLHLLDRATEKKRVGEAAALSVAALSVTEPAALSPATLVAAIRALQGIGLNKDARRLAIEAAILLTPAASE